MPAINPFTQAVLDWYHIHGRHDLPWQNPATPYRVWLSETMLQQTQVKTVMGYFDRFVSKLPNIRALAEADLDIVMQLWAGLGYYRRAKYLHLAAQAMVTNHQGQLPNTLEALMALPGIGRSTAGAILTIAYHKPSAILDGNVKRVLCRHFGIEGWPDSPKAQKQLWPLAESLTPKKDCHHYTQAIMDLGATLCTRSNPQCENCPVHLSCYAYNNHATSTLPTKKAKKAIPIKELHFWLLQKASGELLLTQRPNEGLWANLWTFPEGDCPVKDIEMIDKESLPTFEHLLTHYRLIISSTIIQLTSTDTLTTLKKTHKTVWCMAERIQTDFGTPKYMDKILKQHDIKDLIVD